MNAVKGSVSCESEKTVLNGWMMLLVTIAGLLGSAALVVHAVRAEGHPDWILFVVGILAAVVFVVLLAGFFTLQPNEARVLLLFGAYRGTVRQSGFHWGNPFYSNGDRNSHGSSLAKSGFGSFGSRNKVSLRARTLTVEKLKVNDKRGNPIEIAAVVVWRVQDTAQAVFDVDNYENYVHTQSETALRHLASGYNYDDAAENEATLRGNVEEVSLALREELQRRLANAGVAVDEARLTNLSYAPEIAQVMLRRQQAEAVISARQKIVHGAVSMVDLALKELASKQVVDLDDERKAAMVSNLMIVLCSESEVHPVVNTGTLYN
jgi:regulator of protease activity HflC (stomatin/prohibitin superfamily)